MECRAKSDTNSSCPLEFSRSSLASSERESESRISKKTLVSTSSFIHLRFSSARFDAAVRPSRNDSEARLVLRPTGIAGRPVGAHSGQVKARQSLGVCAGVRGAASSLVRRATRFDGSCLTPRGNCKVDSIAAKPVKGTRVFAA